MHAFHLRRVSFIYTDNSSWEWVDGSKWDYTNWSTETEQGAQPSYCCPEDQPSYCGTIGSNSMWFDAACIPDNADPIDNYICQKEKGSF